MANNITITSASGNRIIKTYEQAGLENVQGIVWETQGGVPIAVAEDTAAADNGFVVPAGVVRKDAAVSLVDTDGDNTRLTVDGVGRLWTNPSGVVQPVTVGSGAISVVSHVTEQASIFASAARTGSPADVDLTNEYHVGVAVTVRVSAAAAGADVKPSIEMKAQQISNQYIEVYRDSAALPVSTGTYVYYLHPTAPAVGGGTTKTAVTDFYRGWVQTALWRFWRFRMNHTPSTGGPSVTYTVEACYLK